jgi:glucan phosphorylase
MALRRVAWREACNEIGSMARALKCVAIRRRRLRSWNFCHRSYLEADQRLRELYADSDAWVREVILNAAGSGKFPNDRTITEYAREIWEAKPCPVP